MFIASLNLKALEGMARQAKDPVCGMMVDTSKALSHAHNGTTYYFCSQSCKDKFAAAPNQYV
ncbi:MAG: YHS domain-containing protein [Dehalococcoidia bacterium]|jgi:Cu+-exporting ATPase|nr:YHS domain-containing protein [Dehalococcoidia bacterium]